MAEILARIKGKFILSINDHPEMRKVYRRFKIRPVRLKYFVNKTNATEAKELLISNF